MFPLTSRASVIITTPHMPEKCSYKYLRVGAYLAELLLQILTPLWQLEINAGVPRESHSSPIKG